MIEIIGAISNAIRGGQLPIKGGRYINAALFGLVVIFVTMNPWLGLACVPAMYLGSKPGFGKYPGAVGGWETKNLTGQIYIDALIAHLVDRPVLWGLAGLLIRGMFWGICVAIPFACFGYYETAVWLIALSATLPLTVGASCHWAKRFEKYTTAWGSIAWSANELIYGAILWSAL